ncbi:MAG TPA: S-layer homology domain-containing protein [Syntrophomonadaceae bacterium]|nr:S-layer homology domain-containing protein [Syntrophomonadaceae bacterium]
MKKIFFITLWMSCLLVFLCQLPVLAASEFSDVSKHWAKDYINQMQTQGLISGYPDGSFKPDNSMTHAEFTVVLIKATGATPSTSSSASFSDTSTHWAKAYIEEAVAKGILVPSEYPQGFKPNDPIKRSEVCAMMVRALAKPSSTGTTSFKDQSSINQSMYKGYIKAASELGLMGGYTDGTFGPFNNMKRGEVCRVLSSFITALGTTTANSSTSTTTTTTTTPTNTGSLHLVTLGEDDNDIAQGQVSFQSDLQQIAVSSLAVQGEVLQVNGQYNFALNSTANNPDIIIKNIRYGISSMQVSSDKLVISPAGRKINNLTKADVKYTSDYIKLYIQSSSSKYYLSDMLITDQYNVKIGGQSYDLSNDRISVKLGDNYYDIEQANLNTDGTTLKLTSTDNIITNGLTMSDIAAIYDGKSHLNLDNITSIKFVVNHKLYNLSEVSIDAAGNILADGTSYAANKNIMIIDDSYYQVNSIVQSDNEFTFRCATSTMDYLVEVDDKYYDENDVQVQIGTSLYDMSSVNVVSHNYIRIGSKHYTPSGDDVLLKINGTLYTVKSADYDSTKQALVFTTTTTVSSSEPDTFVFYLQNSVYYDGDVSNVNIKVGSKWVAFNKISITDPQDFSYNGSSYDLIGAALQINDTDFTVTDTTWHGKSQALDLIMKES